METSPNPEKNHTSGWRLVIGSVGLLILILLAALVYALNHGKMNTADWTMLLLLTGSAGGVLFYLIDPQSQHSFSFRKIVNLGGAAAIGAGFMLLAHWLAINPPSPPYIPPDAQIVLLDSPLHNNVYDDDRRKYDGANSDEIKGFLATLPNLSIRAIRCTPGWSDHQSLLESSPDLIVIHYSTFRDANDTNDYPTLLKQFLKTMADSESTKFLIYSRQFVGDNHSTNLGPLIDAVPNLNGRLETFYVRHGTFMHQETATKLRNVVKRLLGS